VDPNPGVGHLAAKRIARSSIDVTCSPLNAERLAFADGLFDTVVSTFTLCSIRDVEAAPAELRRVMKPTGRLHFLEHGLADDPRVRQWQHRLTPLNRRIGDGYHLNRNAAELLRGAGFRVESLQAFYLRSVPRVGGYLYSATAVKGSAKAFPLGPEADR
jgi:ubiquinone/menaquinone biosynthesis C-methylase UbiE